MLKTIQIGLFALLGAAAMPGHAACPPAPMHPTPEMMQSAVRNAGDHGYLWRVSKDGRTSYLYGTIHVGKPEWIFPGPTVMEALRATDTMALEFDMMDPKMQESMKNAMTELHGNPLPAALAQRMRTEAKSLCVPYDTLAEFPPEMQIAVLSVTASRLEGLDATFAVDGVLTGIGHAAGKNMVSLETPASQIKALVMKTPEETAEFVAGSLDELEDSRARKVLRRLAAAWANSDYAELDHYEDWCDCLRTEIERKIMKRLLDERNPAMAERVDALHQSGRQVFVAVGSMHMFGPVGLPALMEKRGYRVERVDFKASQAHQEKPAEPAQPGK